jgi:predicted TIM-barrel fold metal-dependent hydrolase
MASNRYMIISADCHAGVPEDGYRPYLERRYWDAYDEFVANQGRVFHAQMEEIMGGELVDEEIQDAFDSQDRVASGGKTGAWKVERRIQELEQDGTVGEVIFPDFQLHNEPPFNVLEGPGYFDAELQAAGARAYNRWVAELAAPYPDRIAPVALITISDIDQTVKEIEWARKAGLRGGIMLHLIPDHTGIPQYHHPRYEPIWAACEEFGMPVHSHPPGGTAKYGKFPGSQFIFATEFAWYCRRPLWMLIWSGVFERHPGLRYVATEQGSDWVEPTLKQLDGQFDGPNAKFWSEGRPLRRPSEYWARQCYVGASLRRGQELALRYTVGVENMMWGSDYPHRESTWPNTEQRLREVLNEIPEQEIRLIMGETAAKVYNVDAEKLQTVVERVGPDVLGTAVRQGA